MAIFADYTRTTHTLSETETVQQEVTYPSNLTSDHPDYSKRGQTIMETFAAINTVTDIVKDAYIVISHYNFYKFEKNDEGEYLFDILFKVYVSKDAYLNDVNDFVYEDYSLGQKRTVNPTDDLRVLGYQVLKNLTQITNTIDD